MGWFHSINQPCGAAYVFFGPGNCFEITQTPDPGSASLVFLALGGYFLRASEKSWWSLAHPR